jgi:hypothetical protein
MTGPAAVVYDEDLVKAWKIACDQIANHKTVNYVLITSFGNAWQGSDEQRQALDKGAVVANAELPSSVASMLLPKVARLSKQNAA